MDSDTAIRLPSNIPLTDQEFLWIKDYLYKNSGIALNDSKKALVSGRLEKRLRHYQLTSYYDYFQLISKPEAVSERLMAIDLLTTNETYFFREPQHFDFLIQQILPKISSSQTFRIWSAASSSGEEAYTLAMVIAEYSKNYQWEIIGTDISTAMLEKARRGLYPIAAAEKIPRLLLKKYCLKGKEEYQDFLLIDPIIRNRVTFSYANLIQTLPELGVFDIIFLRNVMIYFDLPTKQLLLKRIYHCLKPGGYLFISHSESLQGLNSEFQPVIPSVYRKNEL